MDGVVFSAQDSSHSHSRTHSDSHCFTDADLLHVEDVRAFPNQMGSGRRDARVGCETLSSGRSYGGAGSPKMRQSASQKGAGAKSNVRRRNVVYSRNPLLACFVGDPVLSSRASMHLSMHCDSAVGSQRTLFSLIPVDRSQMSENSGEPQSPQLSCIGQVKHRHVKTASTAADVVTEDLTRMDINDGVIPHSVPVSRSPPRGHYQKHDMMKFRKCESLWPQKEDSLRHQLESSFKLQRVETFQLRREESFKAQKELSFKLQKEESYKLMKGLKFKLQGKEQPPVNAPTIDDIPHLDLAGGNGVESTNEESLSTSCGDDLTFSRKDAEQVAAESALDTLGVSGLDMAGADGLDVTGRSALERSNACGVAEENAVGATGESAGCVANADPRNGSEGAGKNDQCVLNALDGLILVSALDGETEKRLADAHRGHVWGVRSGDAPKEHPFDSQGSPRMKNGARLTRCSRRVVEDDTRFEDEEKMTSPSHRNSIRYVNQFFRQKLGASMVRSILACGWSSGDVSPPLSPKSERSDSPSENCEIDLSRFAAGEFQPRTPSFRDTRCNIHATLHEKVPDVLIPSEEELEDRRWCEDGTWGEDDRVWKGETEGKEHNDICVHDSGGEARRCSPAEFILQPVTEAALWKRRFTLRPLRVG